MRIVKKTTYKKNLVPLGLIQYLLTFLVLFLFGIGLMPGYYGDIYYIIATLLLFQILVSIVRFRVLNVVFQVVIFILAFIALVPVLGWFIRLLCFMLVLLDFGFLKFYNIEKHIVIKKYNNEKQKPKDAKDAQFKEK